MFLKKLKRRKYFSRILLSYLCLVLMMLGFSSLILNRSDKSHIRQKTDANYAAFQQLCQITEQEIENISRKITKLSADYLNFQCYLNDSTLPSSHQGYDLYKISQRLQNDISSSSYDLFLYIPELSKMVSGNYASLAPDAYFATYYQSGAQAEILADTAAPITLLPLTLHWGEQTLAVRSSLHYLDQYPLVFVLGPDYLHGSIEKYESSTGGSLMILGSDERVLLCSDALSAVDPCTLDLSPGIHTVRLNGESCILFVEKSRLITGKYISVLPVSVMRQSISYYRTYTTVSILLCGFLGILMALLLSRFNYKPISHLAKSMVLLNETGVPPEDEEFQFFERSIQKAIHDKSQLSSRMAKFQKSRRMRMIFNLLNGVLPQNAVCSTLFAEIGETILSTRFAVMVFTVENWDEKHFPLDTVEERPFLSNIIFPNVIEELCNAENRGYVLNVQPSQFACLVNLASGTTEKDLKDICQQALRFLSEDMGIICSCGLGGICDSLKGIHQSFLEASRAQEYKIISGLGQVFQYNALPEAGISYRSAGNTLIQNLLLKAIQDKNDIAYEIFDQIYDTCFENGVPSSPEIAKNFILNLSIQVNNVLKDMDQQRTLHLYDHKFNLDAGIYKTLQDFREYFALQIRNIHQEYQENHKVKSLGQTIQEYIDQHFTDADLDVNTIGTRFDLSPAYCSRIFRQETNQSLLDSITQLRVQKASQLLLESTDTLESIAGQCGFSSSTIFIRNFKKIHGITPGNYRKLMGNS